jgi:hypothetical protein
MNPTLTVACFFLKSAWQAVCLPFLMLLRRLSPLHSGSLRSALTALLLAPLAALHAAEPSLIAHWSFDEGSGDVLHDRSGNKHDGTIHGATWVPSPRGQALRFDGSKDYVDIGKAESLRVGGDFTLTAWITAADVSGRNRLILGDTAGLSVNRNYSLRIDKGRLYFEKGDGAASETLLSAEPFPIGTWQFVAVVFEGPRYFVYQNEKIILEGEVATPMTPTRGDIRRIGGWSAGWFKGDIDEIRLYKRALPQRELMAIFGNPAATDSLRMVPSYRYLHKQIVCDLRCDVTFVGTPEATVAVRKMWGDKPVRSLTTRLQETSPGSGRWRGKAIISMDGFTGGEYEITTTASAPAGETPGKVTTRFVYPDKAPVWVGSREGISDQVIAPFTALRSAKTPQGCTVSPWGRTYEFGATPFVSQISSQDAPMLAAPMRLLARVNGADVVWTPGVSQLAGAGDTACRVSQKLEGTSVSANVTTTIESDGLAKIAWALQADKPVTLDELVVEIPLRSGHARYLNTWPDSTSGAFGGTPGGFAGTSGALTADYASEFQPMVWLGDEARGLQWVCESGQNWSVAEPGKAIQIIRRGDEVVLRLNLVTAPVALAAGGKRDYVFGLLPTPVKPVTEDAWDARIVRTIGYGQELDLPDMKINGKPALQFYAEKGARAIIVWKWWNVFAYTRPIGGYEEKFRRLVKECHRYGLKVLPYVGGFLLSQNAPEAKFFGDEMRVTPGKPYSHGKIGDLPAQVALYACQRGPWQDFLVDGIGRLIDDYDVDGVYLDTTTRPLLCDNELHGCGYLKPDGSRGGVYPVFSVRDNLRRIYTAVRTRKPDGIVDVHPYECMNAPGLAWATTYWNGEQLRANDSILDALPLERFRAEFMGYNWGVPADLLYYKLKNYRQSVALAILHDVPVRPEKPADLDAISTLWKVRDEFGVKQARWLPYWSNPDVVKAETKDCYVSLFAHPQGRVLAIVSNLSKEKTDVRLSLNLDKLDLPANVSAKDAVSRAALTIENGDITLNLAAQDYCIVWIEADTALNPNK